MAQVDQKPVDSKFHAKSTGQEVLADQNLSGKVAIVTGGYSGLGLETTKALLARGGKVIVPVRSPKKASESLEGIAGDLDTYQMDLSDLTSIRNFAEKVSSQYKTLDFLINNAGVMACPERRIGPGWESQFGVNHMGHFALTQELISLLINSPGVRVIALSSTAHKISGIRWEDMQFEADPYHKWAAYGQSKTANALFANALSRRFQTCTE